MDVDADRRGRGSLSERSVARPCIFHDLPPPSVGPPLFQVGCDTSLTDSLRAKALSCIAFLIKLKSKVTNARGQPHLIPFPSPPF